MAPVKGCVGYWSYLFFAAGIFCLSLSMPVLLRWSELAQNRQLVVISCMFIGMIFVWLYAHLPEKLRSSLILVRDRLGWSDGLFVLTILFFVFRSIREYTRWDGPNLSTHKMLIIATEAFLAILGIYYLWLATTLQKLKTLALTIAGLLLFIGLSQQITGFRASRGWRVPQIATQEENTQLFKASGIMFGIGLGLHLLCRKKQQGR